MGDVAAQREAYVAAEEEAEAPEAKLSIDEMKARVEATLGSVLDAKFADAAFASRVKAAAAGDAESRAEAEHAGQFATLSELEQMEMMTTDKV